MDELISKVEIQVSNFSLETSIAEAEKWEQRKSIPAQPLWLRAQELARKEVVHSTLKKKEKKKESKQINSAKIWWSSLELEKRKAMYSNPIVSTRAPDAVIHSAQRNYVKLNTESKLGRKELLDGVNRELRSDHTAGTSNSSLVADPYGLLEGSSTLFIPMQESKDIIDIYGLHDENTLVCVTPCKAVSLLRSLNLPPIESHEPQQELNDVMSKTWNVSSNTRDMSIKTNNSEEKTTERVEKTEKAATSRSSMVDIGNGVGRLMARTSFGRTFGNYRSPPEPEGGDSDGNGTVGQLLEVKNKIK